MDHVFAQIINEWGTLGVLIIGLGYLIYETIKASKDRKDNNQSINGKIDLLNDKIDFVDTKVSEVASSLDKRIDRVECVVENLPKLHLQTITKLTNESKELHSKMFDDLIKLGPNLHKILKEGIEDSNGDHIFIGSFHNGNSSLTGIPYYKFDIIAERFSINKIEQDCEFAHMYKDADLMRFDMLPSILIQQEMIHFIVPEEGEVEMSNIDDIIWRRMRGRGIRQIALRLLRDQTNTPSGFVGIVKYDLESLNLDGLNNCGELLELEYHKSELKENKYVSKE